MSEPLGAAIVILVALFVIWALYAAFTMVYKDGKHEGVIQEREGRRMINAGKREEEDYIRTEHTTLLENIVAQCNGTLLDTTHKDKTDAYRHTLVNIKERTSSMLIRTTGGPNWLTTQQYIEEHMNDKKLYLDKEGNLKYMVKGESER